MLNFTHPIPLSLYIHFPWCVRKCPYCDFNSHSLKQTLPEDAYIDALLLDFEQDLNKIQERTIGSIFLGGGTPSLFSPQAIQNLFKALRSRLNLASTCEITLEANPGTVEQTRFEGYREAGVNRLSLGIQSLTNTTLKAIGRIHGVDEALKAIAAAKSAGFDNFNLDLMFGLPQQSYDEAVQDLQTAVSLGPAHISWYQLTLEPNTLFYREPPSLPQEEEVWQMQQTGQAFLQKQGFNHYEVSAYSRAGYPCKHNRNYWEYGDYLGIGAGAHSKITNRVDMHIQRFQKHRHPKDYLAAKDNFIAETKILEKAEIPCEFMLNALRLNEPIAYSLFEQRTGLPIKSIRPILQHAVEQGLLQIDADYFVPTPTGRLFLNDLTQMFLR